MIKFTSFIFYTCGIFMLGMYAAYEKLDRDVRGFDWFLMGFITLYFLSHYKQSLRTTKNNNNENENT